MLMRQCCLLGYAVYQEYGYHWYHPHEKIETHTIETIDYSHLVDYEDAWLDEIAEWPN